MTDICLFATSSTVTLFHIFAFKETCTKTAYFCFHSKWAFKKMICGIFGAETLKAHSGNT